MISHAPAFPSSRHMKRPSGLKQPPCHGLHPKAFSAAPKAGPSAPALVSPRQPSLKPCSWGFVPRGVEGPGDGHPCVGHPRFVVVGSRDGCHGHACLANRRRPRHAPPLCGRPFARHCSTPSRAPAGLKACEGMGRRGGIGFVGPCQRRGRSYEHPTRPCVEGFPRGGKPAGIGLSEQTLCLSLIHI